MNVNVKIVSPNNEVFELKYYDILYFCQKETEKYIDASEQNLKEFVDFRKNYSFFLPYFDFVMLKLKYILINPLFYENSYLLSYNDKYYIMTLNNDYSYEDLINQKPNFSFDFIAANDQNICMDKTNGFIKEHIGFYLDEDGNFYKNYKTERHLKMGRLILNQKMINSISICTKYRKYINIHGENSLNEFLVNDLGYVVGFPADQNIIIYNSKRLTQKQLKYLNVFKFKYKIEEEDNYHKFR